MEVDTNKILCLDVGGTHIRSAIYLNDHLQKITKEPTQAQGYDHFVNQLHQIISRYLPEGFSKISISIPGIIENEVHTFAGDALSFLSGHSIENVLKKYPVPIFIENDANCFTYAEAVTGAGRNYHRVVGITWGTGIGLGFVAGGSIQKNYLPIEFGHTPIQAVRDSSTSCACKQNNCLESHIGSKALKKISKHSNLKSLFESTKEVDKQIVEKSINYLSAAIMDLIDQIHPEIIILGGGVSQMDEAHYQNIRNQVNRNVEIVRASISADAAIYGAAFLASKT